MPALCQLIPDTSNVATMQPAELAGYILESLLSVQSQGNKGMFNLHNVVSDIERQYDWSSNRAELQKAEINISAAWMWLRVNGMLCPDPGANPSWDWVTPLGHQVRDRAGLQRLIANQELPEQMLHPALLIDVRPLFLQGRFDTSVFEAFKALEVTVRKAAGFGHDKIGTKLMSAAFHPTSGPLTDLTLEEGERTALQQLMVGAIGSYKNPSSHRKVQLAMEEAREMIVLASHLLKITESRRPARPPAP
jgi:uncharacterized protein (TIGR02391 family)